MKKGRFGEVLCDQKGCEFPATFTLVWTKHQCYCAIHTQTVLGVAEAMGFPTPAATVRPMTADEMMPEEDSAQ